MEVRRKEDGRMQENVIFEIREGALTARLQCEIDHHTASGLRERIDGQMFRHRPELLILDFSGVRFMDSSGLGLIIGRSEVAAAIGASVRLTGLSPAVTRLLRLSGLERIKNVTIGK